MVRDPCPLLSGQLLLSTVPSEPQRPGWRGRREARVCRAGGRGVLNSWVAGEALGVFFRSLARSAVGPPRGPWRGSCLARHARRSGVGRVSPCPAPRPPQACIDENLEVVRFLVEQGATVNQADNEGWTPLHVAASCGYLDIAR